MDNRRKKHQENAKLREMQIISLDTTCTSRQIAKKVRISNGTACYLLSTLIDMELIKLTNFKDKLQKVKTRLFIDAKRHS